MRFKTRYFGENTRNLFKAKKWPKKWKNTKMKMGKYGVRTKTQDHRKVFLMFS